MAAVFEFDFDDLKWIFRYETAGLVAVTRSMDIAVAYVIQVLNIKLFY
jgi:hypothetical protein